VPILTSKAQVQIPVKDISNLPPGASYSDKSGQASVKVRVVNDTVFVDAVCDSLLRQVETYEMELNRMHNEVETRLKIEETNNVQTAFKWCLIGVFAGSVITIVIYSIIKKRKK
jgi:hypothetical protein